MSNMLVIEYASKEQDNEYRTAFVNGSGLIKDKANNTKLI